MKKVGTWNFFGPPPLLPGEDAAAYDDLLARVSGTIKPRNILEEIWVRDTTDLTWEVSRLRRLKATLLAANVDKPASTEFHFPDLADVKLAESLDRKIDAVERIDRMTMYLESRRNAALRELDRHRASLRQPLHQPTDVIEHAAFDDLGRKQITRSIADSSAAQ